MKIVDKGGLAKVLAERQKKFRRVEIQVAKIISRVKEGGEAALRELTRTYDGVEIADFRVSASEIAQAKKEFLSREWQQRLERVAGRIRRFAEKEVPKGFSIAERSGKMERVYVSVEPVGIYIPAGTAPLVSTVLMAVVPARVAGVKRIVIATPPGKDGKANRAVVATAAFLGVTEIYKIGGAQAIAALAFGAGRIPKVAKIVGPGNEYVSAAKRLLYGIVDLDCPAGPSEVVVFADKTADPCFVKAELASQAEHRNGLAVLITPDRRLLEKIAGAGIEGFAIYAEREKALSLIEMIAPEHLVVMADKPEMLVGKIKSAGAIFIGDYTPVAVGDYLAGPSHILPTSGTAVSFSGLSALTFLRSFARLKWDKPGLKEWAEDISALADLEGLPEHKSSILTRLR